MQEPATLSAAIVAFAIKSCDATALSTPIDRVSYDMQIQFTLPPSRHIVMLYRAVAASVNIIYMLR